MDRTAALTMLALFLLLAAGCTAPPARDPLDTALQAHRDAVVNDTRALIQIPSSAGDADGPERALRAYLGLARGLGLHAVELDGRVGYVEYGSGDEYIAVLGHLDTVPAGEGWTRDPYGGEVAAGRLYGRGALDDKGPMVAALHALAALREAEVPLARKVRVIIGTDEETDDKAIPYYRSREPDPVAGFSPDGDFPVVYAEKGLLWADWHRPARASGGPADLLSLESGTAPNVVPDRAAAVLKAAEPEKDAAALREAGCAAVVEGRRIRVTATGTAGHGSEPELGVNALVRLAAALDRVGIDGDGKEIVRSLNTTFNRAPDGGILGLPAPNVSVNLGVCQVENGTARLSLDVRYPGRLMDEEVWAAVNRTAEAGGWEAVATDRLSPLEVDPDGPLVQALLGVYRDETGDLNATPRSVGYTTYAKSLPNTVAFGPLMPGAPDPSHEPDESVGVEELALQARCYARAVRALAGDEAAPLLTPARSPGA